VLFCEGERTEPEYFVALRREPAVKDVAAVDLRIEPKVGGSQPLALVQRAVAAMERNRREEGEIDEIWCVFDVEWPENHPHLQAAVELARTHDIKLAISNPCFELWLILHFEDHRRWLSNREASTRRALLDRTSGKGVDGTVYMSQRYIAGQRAAALDAEHVKNRTEFPGNNPSSGVYRLVASVSPPPVVVRQRSATLVESRQPVPD
jgi:hypothetical protein